MIRVKLYMIKKSVRFSGGERCCKRSLVVYFRKVILGFLKHGLKASTQKATCNMLYICKLVEDSNRNTTDWIQLFEEEQMSNQ